MPKVEVVRPFNERHNGGLVHPGEMITVTDLQRDELKRLGLVQDPQAEKLAPAPANKMAAPVANKAAAPEIVATARRGPGRPRRAL